MTDANVARSVNRSSVVTEQPTATMLDAITPVLLTYNEAPNIARTLQHLSWARDIVVVDSGSTDGTLDILANMPRVRVFSRPFDTHHAQWRFATEETDIATAWLLRLDAGWWWRRRKRGAAVRRLRCGRGCGARSCRR